MHGLRRTAVSLAAATGLAAAASGIVPVQAASTTAKALKPGQWTQVTSKLTNIDDIGLARGKDGVLHVLWTSGSTGHRQVADTPVSATGVVGKPVTIRSHIFSATNPDATATSAGLAVFWNAVQSNSPDSQVGTFEATRPSRGGAWKVVSVTPATFSWGDFVSASAGPSGTAWTDFGNSNGIVVHHLGHAPVQLQYPTCCVYSEGVGVDSKTGTTWVTYLSVIPHHMGIFTQKVTATGQRSGSPILLPTSNRGGGPLPINQRITATGLGAKRAGVYTTFLTGSPNTKAVNLIKLGSGHPVNIAKFTATIDDTGGSTLAVDPFGRVWVSWFRTINDRSALWVRRAKAGAGNFGQVGAVKLPAGVHNIWKVYISAQARKLDIVALMTVKSTTAYWTTQVQPPKQ
jgi:hypothetical protein